MILRMFLRTLSAAVAVLFAVAVAPQEPTPIAREAIWSLEVDIVAVGPGTVGSLGEYPVTASRATPGTLEAPLGGSGAWPGGRLSLTLSLDRLLDDEAIVDLAAVVAPARGKPVRASRRFALRESGSQIVEIFGEDERHLLLSIRGERGTRPVVRRLASVGEPVVLLLEVEKIEGDKTIALETNDLRTFVGESVEYSFDFGGDGERLRLVLTPLSLTGSIAQVRAQVSGRLPDVAGPIVLSRDHRFAASRGATSSLDVVAGDPPRGYRFRITPDF